jgi:hypothetical protein
MVILPYEATLGRLFKPDEYTRSVRRGIIDLPLSPVVAADGSLIQNAFFVTPQPEHEDVVNFKEFINLGTEDKPQLVIDARQYMKYDERSGVTRTYLTNDWQLQVVRMAMTLALMREGTAAFSRLTDLPARVFIDWVAGRMVSEYKLRPASEMLVRIIVATYYQSLIMPEIVEPGEERLKAAPIIARLSYAPITTVLELLDSESSEAIGPLKNANDLAVALSEHSRALTIGKIKFADLHHILKSTWFGTNSTELVGIGIEHLPTWIAVLYTAVTDKSFRKSKITELAEKVDRGALTRQFINLVNIEIDKASKPQ